MLATTTSTTTLFRIQYPTLIYMTQKNRYKYGESTGFPVVSIKIEVASGFE